MRFREWQIGLLLLIVALVISGAVACGGDSVSIAPPTPTPPPVPTPQAGELSLPMPIRSFSLSGGAPIKLLGLPVNVAGRNADLLIDTGSSGVRILEPAAGATNLLLSNVPDTVEFGDGTRFSGVLATAPVSFASVATEVPVTIQVVRQIDCIPTVPNCPGPRLLSGPNFSGIIGTSLANRTSNANLYSPLTRLPDPFDSGYIIRTGGQSSNQGTFIIGLTSGNTSGFTFASVPQAGSNRFPDNTPIYDDAALEPAYSISNSVLQNVPGRTLFDSGDSDIRLNTVLLGAQFSINVLDPGRIFGAVLSNGFSYQVRVGNPITPGRDRIFLNSGGTLQVLGMPFFLQFDMAFDVRSGRIGFRVS